MTDGATRERLGDGRTDERPGAGLPARHPALGMALGALSVSVSPIVIDLSGTSPGTASFYRCLPAVPVLALMARRERRRGGAPPRRWPTTLAGLLFAGDMLLWTQAIADVGAGLSTVLVNVQVVLVPLLAWLVDRERVSRAFVLALPVLLAGVMLTAGLADGASTGRAPGRGTVFAVAAALCYAGFLFLLRHGADDGRPVTAYRDVTVSAAPASLVAGALWHGVDLTPGWVPFGWLLVAALSSQIVGWSLVALCSPRLPGHVGASILLLTPAGAVAMGAAFLGERPSALQLAGCVLILAGAYAVTGRRSSGGPSRPERDRRRSAT